MTTCKMTHAIQGIMVPHYIHNINYGLPHVLKIVNLYTSLSPHGFGNNPSMIPYHFFFLQVNMVLCKFL